MAVKKAVKKESKVKESKKITKSIKEIKLVKPKKEKESKTEKKAKVVLEDNSFDNLLDDLEKDNGLLSSFSEKSERVSTTLASIDLILNGGLVAGLWYTFFGGEQSSKTTLATSTLGSLALGLYADKIPYKVFFNYEGSFSPEYFVNQLKTSGFKGKSTDIFGMQNPETGKYITRPVVRKYDEQIGEKFFDLLSGLMRRLPDKYYKQNKWWLVYEDNKKLDKYSELKEKCDQKLFKQTGKLWVETDNPYPQAVFVVDSYPAMLPEKQDVDDANDPIAIQARMFSTQLKRVKGRMSAKKIIVMGINQLRAVPMAMFGPTEAEPCGEALKFFSDARLKMTSRSSVFGNKGKVLKEKSVTHEGKKDYYRYVNIKTIKNKTSIPDLETWVRVWVRDGKGEARGYDPVFDSWYFLTQIGACNGGSETGSLKKVTLSLDILGIKDWPSKPKTIEWPDFKRLILCDKDTQEKVLKDIGYKGKYFNLRDKILKAGNNPKTFELFIEQEAKRDKGGDDE